MDLTVTALSCHRGDRRILRDVGFAVPAGQALILRGPNGAGKTTLLRSLAGLTQTSAGQISAPQDAMAYAAHTDGLKAQLTVAENLTFWAQIFGTGDAAYTQAVAAFDLGPLAARRTADLSAGQKRRTGLARLLLTGRPIWLLDEPTVSLDAQNVARFAAAIRTHLISGGSAIIATHIDLGLDALTLDITPFATGRYGWR
ncbi:MAG: heme ABC exporter ATP-binding protein CcmA [Pseudomonadota bacterium]